MRNLSILLAAGALGGCAASSYCEGEYDYQKAESVPPLQAAEGLQIPDSPSALRIPQPPANPVAYAETYKDEEGDDTVRCLDKPPAMSPPPELKEPAPAPAATGTPAPVTQETPAPATPPPDQPAPSN